MSWTVIKRRDFLKGAAVTTFLGPAALAELLAACQGTTSSQAGGATLTIGVSGDPATLDPSAGQSTRSNETIKNIYAQWVRYKTKDSGQGYLISDKLNFEGDAIESWKLDSDNQTLHLKVRTAKFASGNPMTADDFIYKAQRAFGVKIGDIFDFQSIGISDPSQVTKDDTQNFTMKLAHPTSVLYPILRDQDDGIIDSALVKQHVTSDDQWAQKWLAQNAAASGAYTVSSWQPGSKLVLKANPNYWGPTPYFTTIVLQEIPSDDNRSLLLRNGSIDIAEDLSLDAATRLKGASGVKVISVPTINQNMFGFLLDKAPFNDIRLRQAIAYAIPYDSLVKDVLHGEALVAKGGWPQNSIWFSNQPYPYTNNPSTAKQMLTAAGHPNGFSFTVEIRDDDTDAQALAVPVQTALAQVGVTMNINKQPAAAFQQHLFARSMQAWIQSNVLLYVDDPFYRTTLFYASTGVINWFKYNSASMDNINNELSTELDVNKRKDLAAQAQKLLNDDLPMICLGETNFVLPMRDNIGGYLYEPDALPVYRLLKRT
jgi:peptide/nickel transport system substrate-binding protein